MSQNCLLGLTSHIFMIPMLLFSATNVLEMEMRTKKDLELIISVQEGGAKRKVEGSVV